MPILWRICTDVDGELIGIQEASMRMTDRLITIAEASRKFLVDLYTDACQDAETTAAVRNQFIE